MPEIGIGFEDMEPPKLEKEWDLRKRGLTTATLVVVSLTISFAAPLAAVSTNPSRVGNGIGEVETSWETSATKKIETFIMASTKSLEFSVC